MVNRSELVAAVAGTTAQSTVVVDAVLDAVLTTIVESLQQGDSVVLPGFGTFERQQRLVPLARRPGTTETIDIATTSTPTLVTVFEASHSLEQADNADPRAQKRTVGSAPPGPPALEPEPTAPPGPPTHEPEN